MDTTDRRKIPSMIGIIKVIPKTKFLFISIIQIPFPSRLIEEEYRGLFARQNIGEVGRRILRVCHDETYKH